VIFIRHDFQNSLPWYIGCDGESQKQDFKGGKRLCLKKVDLNNGTCADGHNRPGVPRYVVVLLVNARRILT
jgi:hypothetical protein